MSDLVPATEEEWQIVRRNATEQQTDGCTRGTQAYLDCCYLHDTLLRTQRSWKDGRDVSKAEADLALRVCIQRRSVFGKWSPMAWWRLVAVKYLWWLA